MFNEMYQLSQIYGYAVITGTLFITYLVILSVIDMRRSQLPDRLTLSLLWLGLLLHALFTPQYLASAVIGAAVGYLIFWVVYWLVKLMTHKEGLGYGDFKMMAAIGVWVGWECLPFVTVFASLAGIFAFILRFFLYGNKGEIPFGPFLAVAGGSIYISQRVYSLADPLCVVCVTFKPLV